MEFLLMKISPSLILRHNMKKILFLPLLLISSLSSCGNSTPTKFDIKDFYSDLEVKNYQVSDGELTQIFYDEDTLIYQIKDQVDTGVVKMNQGIFEIHKTTAGEYETHGMITANTDLDILDGCNNFHNFANIKSSSWKYNQESNNYSLSVRSNYGILVYTGYFSPNDSNSIDKIFLSKVKNHEYKVDVKYKTTAKSAGKVDYTITFDHFNVNVNEKLKEFTTNTTVTKPTDWNEYQLSAFNQYGFTDIPYLDSYTIGLKLVFVKISDYASGGYACIAYDFMSSPSKENSIKEELTQLGFTQKGDRSFYKETETPNYNLNIQFRYILYEEIELMVQRGEASPGDLLAYPNGYMQLLFAYALGEIEVTFEELNDALTSTMNLPKIDDTVSFVSQISMIDYKEALNSQALNELEIFEDKGLEPGPIYDEMVSFYLYIEQESDAISYLDSYCDLIEESGYLVNGEEDKSIAERDGKCVEYYVLDEATGAPRYIVDIYLYNSAQVDEFEWDGVTEIILTKYTDLGIALYYSE